MIKKWSSEIFAAKMEIFTPKIRYSEILGPAKKFPSPKLGATSPPLPNTNPKSLTPLALNGSKDANIISHSKFLLKVVGWLGMWRTTVSLGPRLHILAIHSKFHY